MNKSGKVNLNDVKHIISEIHRELNGNEVHVHSEHCFECRREFYRIWWRKLKKKEKIEIFIPFLYPSRNKMDSMGHWQRYKAKKRIKDNASLFVKSKMMREDFHRINDKVKVRMTLYFKDRRRRDKDNYAPKDILDVLSLYLFMDDNVVQCDLDWDLKLGELYEGPLYYAPSEGVKILVEKADTDSR